MKNIARVLTSVLYLLFVFNQICFAQNTSFNRKDAIMGLINQLNKDYVSINKALKELEESINDYPHTSLTMSVIKKERDDEVNLVSIEIMDNGNLLQSHIYSPMEKKALEAGGRHQLYKGEIKEGGHALKVVYFSAEGNGPPVKGEAVINLFLVTGKNYFIQLSFKKIENKVEIDYSLLDFINK